MHTATRTPVRNVHVHTRARDGVDRVRVCVYVRHRAGANQQPNNLALPRD